MSDLFALLLVAASGLVVLAVQRRVVLAGLPDLTLAYRCLAAGMAALTAAAALLVHLVFAVFPAFLTLCVSGVFLLSTTDNASIRAELATTDRALVEPKEE